MTLEIVRTILVFCSDLLDTPFYVDGIRISYLDIFLGVSFVCFIFFIARAFTRSE